MNAATADMAEVINPRSEEKDRVARAKAGDTAAFEQLYRANAGRIYALCLRMAGNTADAEDLTQDVFVRAWQKLASFRGDSAFSTWLHRLAVNLVLTERRTANRRNARVMVTDELESFDRGQSAPPPGIRMDLEQGIAALPDGARKVFILHDIEGYKHGEIASMMGLATGTTKAQLHRARKLLREVLA